MAAGVAMLILALGALVMVLCMGFGDTEDSDDDDLVREPRPDEGPSHEVLAA